MRDSAESPARVNRGVETFMFVGTAGDEYSPRSRYRAPEGAWLREGLQVCERGATTRLRPLSESCRFRHGSNQILQSPEYVVIFQEKIHDFRLVSVTDEPDLPDHVRQWLGVSRGHWEGDTLVVETKNFHAQADFVGSGVDRHVVERFTRRGEDAIEYSFTVTDPSVWTRPWSAMVPWRAAEGPLFEYACHEGKTIQHAAHPARSAGA